MFENILFCSSSVIILLSSSYLVFYTIIKLNSIANSINLNFGVDNSI
nr:MAG TPA: hypothetical protein [Caudoviricetes sp.]DAZ25083.1 MAG TPA: hypothetical protein [Caudoviricetes sp.]